MHTGEPRRTGLPDAWQNGWLLFEPIVDPTDGGEGPRGAPPEASVGLRRRLAPVPAEWQSCPDAQLAALCERACVTVARGGKGGPQAA
jgi:hypothetical protein